MDVDMDMDLKTAVGTRLKVHAHVLNTTGIVVQVYYVPIEPHMMIDTHLVRFTVVYPYQQSCVL